jgi:hypothetical protein
MPFRSWTGPGPCKDESSVWHGDSLVFIAGHAMLEKCLKPYKSMTANALLVCASDSFVGRPREAIIPDLDAILAQRMLAGEMLTMPADLSPLPIMGVPGWWPNGSQDRVFYAERQVFRPPGDNYAPAAIYQID